MFMLVLRVKSVADTGRKLSLNLNYTTTLALFVHSSR